MIPKGKRPARLAQRIRNARAAAEASNKQTKIEQIKTKAQHPETKQGGAPSKAGGGKKAKALKNSGFVEETAKKTRKGCSTIAREATRGNKV